jgi:hypothetical protein
MSAVAAWGIVIAAVAFVCVVIPWLGMRMLVPALAAGSSIDNYRGKRVFLGLGVVWVFWIGGPVVLLLLTAAERALSLFPEPVGTMLSSDPGLVPKMLLGFVMATVMAIPAFVFGMIDDSLGGADRKGFRGHVSALLEGRLTTGGLKMVGIGVAALFVGLVIGTERGGDWLHGLLSALVIALAANALNLLDLRPLRALKVYSAMIVSVVVTIPIIYFGQLVDALPAAIAVLVAFLGPVLAIWGYDAREEGMLGDAGANPAGAVAGVAMAIWWPTWLLALAAIDLLFLNLLSERVSFSKLIEGSPFLSRLDAIGRTGVGEGQSR